MIKRSIFLALFLTMLPSSTDAQIKEEESEGDDVQARAKWEYERLRDPSSGLIPKDIRRKELEFAETIPTKESFILGNRDKSRNLNFLQSLSWSQRGPHNLGGRTRALAVDVNDPNIPIAGGVSGRMWKTANGGASWTKTTAQLHNTTCVAQDTRIGKRNIWYCGTGEAYGSYPGDGIYKSVDGGASWNFLPSTATGTPQILDNMFEYTNQILTDPSKSQYVVYAGCSGEIASSIDGGITWNPVLGGISDRSAYTDIGIATSGVFLPPGGVGSDW